MNIAIVGAGPVGIYFAKLCINVGFKVTLIESGNLNKESSHLSRKNIFFSRQALFQKVYTKLVEVVRSGEEESVNFYLKIFVKHTPGKNSIGHLIKLN